MISSPDLVQQLVQKMGARKVEVNFRSPAEKIMSDATWEVVPGVELHYADDENSGSACVFIVSETESQASQYADLVKQHLRPLDEEEILSLPARAPDDNLLAQAILRVGYGSPDDFDDRFLFRHSGGCSIPASGYGEPPFKLRSTRFGDNSVMT